MDENKQPNQSKIIPKFTYKQVANLINQINSKKELTPEQRNALTTAVHGMRLRTYLKNLGKNLDVKG